jgi:endonuclease/exonuclease/phosphatase family metal-dependent hydrolase
VVTQDGLIRSHRMIRNFLKYSKFCFALVLFQCASPLYAQKDDPHQPVEPHDITFIDQQGNIRPMEAVQEQMVAFNKASAQLLKDLGHKVDAQRLKVISFNAGLLNVVPNVVDVPKYRERGKLLIPVLAKTDFDILCLQEVFYAPDLRRLEKFAHEYGYHFYRGHWGRLSSTHGMVILVKKSISDSPPTFKEHRFRVVAWHERLFGYRKGILSATLKLKNGRTLGLTNTHLTAYIRQEFIRHSQVAHMMKVIEALGADYTVVTGDLNSTMEPYPEGSGHEDKLTITQRLISLFNLVDSYSAARPGRVKPTVTLAENPTAEFGISTNLDMRAEERIDFVFARARKDTHVLAEDGGRIFTEDVPIKSKPPWWAIWHWGRKSARKWKNCKLSDHFGVFSNYVLF